MTANNNGSSSSPASAGTSPKQTKDMRTSIQAFSKEDLDENKTWTRRIVEKYLGKSELYYPKRDGGPSLSDAYAFYEHVTLPRHFVGSDDRAEQGESSEPTLLYDPFRTNASSFAEWGVGMDLYFSTLKMCAGILFVAGLLNIHNIMFYASRDYSANGQESVSSVFLIGSALCTTYNWVVCRDCITEDFDHDLEEMARYGKAEDGTILVQHSACNGAQMEQGLVNYATFFFLLLSFGFMSLYLRAREVRADEDKCTASDYSVAVRNPPPKAYEPDEWRAFFEQFGKVTCVTVAINNDAMLRKLTQRRLEQNALRLVFPQGTNMDDDGQVLRALETLERQQRQNITSFNKFLNPLLEITGMVVPPRTRYNNISALTKEIQVLQKKQYDVTTVFVTFETEGAQRNALRNLSVGKMDIFFNNVNKMEPKFVFQGKVLSVEEPVESDSVRWLDLGSTVSSRLRMWIFSLLVTLVSLLVSGLVVAKTRDRYGPYMAGIMVSVFNSVIPEIVNVLMTYERHLTEGSFQTSLYVKITLFRWINTAVLTKLITPLTGTLAGGEEDILPSIDAILISELLVTPLLALMDISSNIYKHIYAPRAQTQEEMNSYFQGTICNIGERYTGLTNIMFVCFFYAALFPGALFYGAAILLATHYCDKFCLMRIWAWQPSVGSQLARFSRKYFFYGSLLAFAIVSAYAWVQFPYDNLCHPTDSSAGNAREYKNVRILNGTLVDSITVEQDTAMVFCSQYWIDADTFPFPPTSRFEREDATYMTDSQRTLVDIYGYTALVLTFAYIALAFGSDFIFFVMSFFKGCYSNDSLEQHIDFSANPEIYGYVPQIKLSQLPFPLLAADVDDIYQGLIGWNDEGNSYDFHSLLFDVPHEGMKRKTRIVGNTRNTGQINDQSEYTAPSETTRLLGKSNPIFSIIKHYPPKWQQEIFDSEKEQPNQSSEKENGNGDSHAEEPTSTNSSSMLAKSARLFGLGGKN